MHYSKSRRRRDCGFAAVLIPVMMLSCLVAPRPAVADDGYELWLRYTSSSSVPGELGERIVVRIHDRGGRSATVDAAVGELQRGLAGLYGRVVDIVDSGPADVVIGTSGVLADVADLALRPQPAAPDGFLVFRARVEGHDATLIVADADTGLLYGAFALLRHLQAGGGWDAVDLADAPRVRLRLLNHWDNLDRSVERGYAGESIWDWWHLPEHVDRRYTDYARANASIGINGTVLNNVNAQAEVLTPRYIAKAAAIADTLRPWGIRVYLSARFSAPVDVGGLETADPLDPSVRAWWHAKAADIYSAIPDFGGFLVKANSEGQPGPQNYGRSHADGANMLAGALAPHGGVVMWRAFVYSEHDPEDRVKQAYAEFRPLDGEFADNVLVQVKNGPLDFQPREPFHPLFGAMPDTPLMMEFQVTQEYLGFATHLVYLGALWEEVLDADTFVEGRGSTVARVVDGTLQGQSLTGIAGVANIGRDRDWSGSPFAQANWYAFGRLAWDPTLPARSIAEEWLKMTFSTDPAFVGAAADMMMASRETVVRYMTPLGLTHIMGTGHHYGPAPWVDDLGRPEWNPYYYHRAGEDGIGFDRTTSGSNAVAQYAAPVGERFADRDTVPDEYLLWFHRVPWDYRMRSGSTLWEALVTEYDRGVEEVGRMQATWAGFEPWVDAGRFRKTSDFLAVQLDEARWWRNACIAYFSAVSGLEVPKGVTPPPHSLEYYESLTFPYAPGN